MFGRISFQEPKGLAKRQSPSASISRFLLQYQFTRRQHSTSPVLIADPSSTDPFTVLCNIFLQLVLLIPLSFSGLSASIAVFYCDFSSDSFRFGAPTNHPRANPGLHVISYANTVNILDSSVSHPSLPPFFSLIILTTDRIQPRPPRGPVNSDSRPCRHPYKDEAFVDLRSGERGI